MPEALLDIVDAGLEGGDLLLELGEVAGQDFAPAALVGKGGFDPAQRLDDRLVFLFEPLEPTIDLVEVPEHISPQIVEPSVDRVEPAVDLRESAIDLRESAIDLAEPGSEELDELFVVSRAHGG
ncbi:MAG TPA: hypothetical protein VGL09_11650 [Methylomirabilota bacterium]